MTAYKLTEANKARLRPVQEQLKKLLAGIEGVSVGLGLNQDKTGGVVILRADGVVTEEKIEAREIPVEIDGVPVVWRKSIGRNVAAQPPRFTA